MYSTFIINNSKEHCVMIQNKKNQRTFGRSQRCIYSCKDLTYQICSMSLLSIKELEFEEKMLTIIENIQKHIKSYPPKKKKLLSPMNDIGYMDQTTDNTLWY